ncbi:RluA family pseudouridine synthase [Liquorilactobacillus mali]|uniref:RluA family pseudouridine synthase n=1 Tax=Liquorilactobacillus mali TaxID=1618 RepID=UPI0023509FFF|nr:RluA family pseudouridine synthase [Liquorilactobacillus mali]MDC7953441.1 RluA family pseudouridine synthase [Liquorilactobacillus mali]MDV7757815.1 RluA family pseudouridine synthase [Liquorilactobacillus mali]
MEYTWTNSEIKQTVKKLLLANGLSQRLLNQIRRGGGEVIVGTKPCKLTTMVACNQAVILKLPNENNDDIVAAQGKLTILYEDKNWLIVDKIAGMTTVPGPSNRETTLVNYVKGYLVESGSDDLVPHIITRLDRFTSGIVLIAKNKVAQGMIDKIDRKDFEKYYLAIVEGNLLSGHAIINKPIGRKDSNIRREVMSGGKKAITEYWVKNRIGDNSLVMVKLHTGRTHQIRVHFDSIGHPLLGDKLYAGNLDRMTRQALHAFKLKFLDPFTQKYIEVECDLPEDMLQVLKK